MPLTSELDALCGGNANLSCYARQGRGLHWSANRNKKRSTARGDQQGFCHFGAIFLHSPLENKLSDGFVWYANLSCYARQGRGLHWSANRNKKRSTARVNQQGFCPFGAIFLHSPLENKLSDGFVWNANLSCYARQGRGLHWSANRNKKRSTARVNLFLLVDQQGIIIIPQVFRIAVVYRADAADASTAAFKFAGILTMCGIK